MEKLTNDELKNYLEAAEQASDGPWKLPSDRKKRDVDMFDPEDWKRMHSLESGAWSENCDFPIAWTFGDYEPEDGEQDARANAVFITQSRTVGPSAAKELLEARKEIEKLRDLLDRTSELLIKTQPKSKNGPNRVKILDGTWQEGPLADFMVEYLFPSLAQVGQTLKEFSKKAKT